MLERRAQPAAATQITEVLDADAWAPGGGLRSPEHWVAWRTGVAPVRAAALVTMARRRGELSKCEALFRAGALTEDTMNLVCLCPFHHRLHHQGAYTIHGDPETPAGLQFTDRWGHTIGPPHHGPVAPPQCRAEPTFTPRTGERLQARWFTWN